MKLRQSARRLQFPLILAFGTMPLPLILFSLRGPELLKYGWIYPAAYAVLAMVSLFVIGKWRLLYGILCGAGLVGAGIVLVPRFWLLSAIASVGYGILLLWSLKIAAWDQKEELPGYMTGTLFAIQLLGQVALRMNGTTGNGTLVPYGPSMKLAFFAFMLLTMLSLNRQGLWEASEKRQRISMLLRQRNILLTLGLFGAALLVSFAPSAYRWVRQLLLWIAGLVLKLLMLFSRPQSGGAAEGGGSMGGMPMVEGAEPSALALFLEKIVTVAAVILITVLVLVLLYRIGRAMARLMRLLWKRLEGYAQRVSEDYEDEITDTRDDPTPEHIGSRRSIRRVSAKAQRSMSPEEKIRYRYLRLLLKHPEWSSGSTPREKLPISLADIYERVRYSDHPVNEEDAAAFTAGTKQI